MRYIAISEEDVTTLKAAKIQQRRYEKMGIKAEVCALIPTDSVGDYVSGREEGFLGGGAKPKAGAPT